VAATGRSLDEIRAYVAAHRELRQPLQPLHADGVGGAARFCRHVGMLMQQDREWAARRRTQHVETV
jgi:hypothetical protein